MFNKFVGVKPSRTWSMSEPWWVVDEDGSGSLGVSCELKAKEKFRKEKVHASQSFASVIQWNWTRSAIQKTKWKEGMMKVLSNDIHTVYFLNHSFHNKKKKRFFNK